MNTHQMTRERLLREMAHLLSNVMQKLLTTDEQRYRQYAFRLRELELSLYRTREEEVALTNEMARLLTEVGCRGEAEQLLTCVMAYCESALKVNVAVSTARTLATLSELYLGNGRASKACESARRGLNLMLMREIQPEDAAAA